MAGLKRSISAVPTTSLMVLAKKRNVSRRTITRAVKEDLKLKNYRLSKCHI